MGLLAAIGNARANLKEKSRLESLGNELAKRDSELMRDRDRLQSIKDEMFSSLELINKEKSLGFPWLAQAYSDYKILCELRLADDLETRQRPARRAAEEVRTLAREKSALRRENRVLRKVHRYYEALFPWLIDFKGDELDELIRQVSEPKDANAGDDEGEDPAKEWLTQAERDSTELTRAEKFQRSLDRYWQSKKTPWRLGRDYERYVGFVHERDGFNVEYHGIEFGIEDLGRDLICSKGGEIRVVQCKYWNMAKTIHEKHVCQVFGTAEVYRKLIAAEKILFDHPIVIPCLYVSCPASPKAQEFAAALGVELIDNCPLKRYPIIKCNVSIRGRTRIYHLPFDQQYDRTLIDYEDECYVETVAEAESLGFRRAYRWRGIKDD
ncbi:MAG: hypothetical protein HYR83_00205 [Planctomycetes bacterium]|nr:hypothetical protein [Planctomycetota bacterium]